MYAIRSYYGEGNIRDTDLISRANQQVAKREGQPIFIELRVLGSTTNVAQTQGLQRLLKFYPIKLAITQEGRPAVFGQDGL